MRERWGKEFGKLGEKLGEREGVSFDFVSFEVGFAVGSIRLIGESNRMG